MGVLLACSDFTPLPHQDEALKLIWWEVMNQENDSPQVEWIQGHDLDCAWPDGRRGWLHTNNYDLSTGLQVDAFDTCVRGLTLSKDHVQVAFEGEILFSSTSLAHECGHAALLNNNYDQDYTHRGPMFADYGHVAKANELLKERQVNTGRYGE